VIGWFVLLAITFAATDTKFINDPANGFGLGWSTAIFDSAMHRTIACVRHRMPSRARLDRPQGAG